MLSEPILAAIIGDALRSELGASRRATKTVMSWTGVSDHAARAWLNGRSSPSGLHLIVLAAHSRSVLTAVLKLTGHADMAMTIEIAAIEALLERLLCDAHRLRTEGR